jgi:hypothetical protein
MAVYLGCDPGANGAICTIIETQYDEDAISFYHTPGGKQPPGYLCNELYNHHPDVTHAAIEDVHSLYGMSAKSNFNFGRNVGMAQEAIIAALYLQGNGIELQLVQPKVWQKAVGITAKGKAIKQAVADLAEKLYPQANLYGPKGGLLDGRADALMIAHWLREKTREEESQPLSESERA